MKKIIIVIGTVVFLLLIFFVGYNLGHKIGSGYGSQFYTKKMWKNNYSQISANYVTKLINEERVKNGVKELVYNKEVCQTADAIAELVYKESEKAYDVKSMKYKNEPDITEEKINKIINNYCKNTCSNKYYSILQYVSLRPETCFNIAGIKMCDGDEEFGLLEKYPQRVVNRLKDQGSQNNNIFLNSQFGCVGVYGGAIILMQVGI